MRAMGSLRLQDVLGEQTGTAMVSGHGNGIQLQGLNPEYTLILMDGEPLIGRTAGTLDLSRIAVANLQRVEILKGPASALWGSDALAGVINLITAEPRPGTEAGLSLRMGANRTADGSLQVGARGKRLGGRLFLNRYSSAGYSLLPQSGQPTVPPFANYTAQSHVSYKPGPHTTIRLSGRFFRESQASTLWLNNRQTTLLFAGRKHDYSLNPSFTHHFGRQQRGLVTGRLYHAAYLTREAYTYALDGRQHEATFFTQRFSRAEGQLDYTFSARHRPTLGAGYLVETVEASRYDQRQALRAPYVFLQHDWTPLPGFNLVVGTRYDGHSQYKAQISPKAALRWQLFPQLTLRAAVGRGYRAPDFRQLYLNFSNPVAGYSVFGSHQVHERVAQLEQQGQLALDPATGLPLISQRLLQQVGSLRPERSRAFHAGLQFNSKQERFQVLLNVFRNDLLDLIETTPVAQRSNGQSVFTYINVNEAFTQGLEAETRIFLWKGLMLNGGYQFLDAGDKAIIRQLKAGNIFRRDPVSLTTERVPLADYGGLFNRSRHSGNLKLFFESRRHGWAASLRGIYRGRTGWQDLNGNAILDQAAEYIKPYTTWHVTASKTWQQRFTLQAGLDNALGHRDPVRLPRLAGRLWYAGFEVKLHQASGRNTTQ